MAPPSTTQNGNIFSSSPLPDPSTLLDASSLKLPSTQLALSDDLKEKAINSKSPDEVNNMPEVRAEIDRLDREIVGLLGQRMRYIEAAARIKADRSAVRDEWRKNDVINKAAAKAHEVNFPEKLVRDVYEVLVEGSIAHEFTKWDARNDGKASGQDHGSL